MQKKARLITMMGVVVLLMATVVSISLAGQYPERPVECIVPWGAGGGSTLFARAFNQPAERFLGQPLPIINIPGASGGLGLIEFMKRPADGYAITTVNTDTVIGSALGTYKHTVEELNFIVRAAVSDTWIYVRKESPFKKFEDVVEYAKKNPGSLKFGGEGYASNEVLAFSSLGTYGIKMKYVNYEGGSEMHAAVLRGEIDMASGEISQTVSFVDSGQMRPLVSASAKRLAGFPDLPTLKELGYDIVLPMLRGIAIKKGTDPAIRKTLENAFIKAADSEEWKKFMASKRLDPKVGFMNSQDFETFIKNNYIAVKQIIEKSGYTIKAK